LREADVTPKAFATAQVWTHAMLGVDPSEVSALCFIEYCAAGGGLMTMRSDCKDGGQYLRIREGTMAFSERMARKLKSGSVKLNSPVAAVTQKPGGVVSVTTKGGQTYQARKVIVSIPTPVYKTIAFQPALPPSKTAVTNRTRYGFYTKYIMSFQKPFWTDKGMCGLAQSFTGPVSVFRDTSLQDDGGKGCLTCFVGGQFGRQWASQDAAAKKASVLKQIGDIFADGQDVSGLFLEAYESPWMEEEYSGWGCPCPSTPPGVLGGGWDALVAPFGNLHFVGTELSTVWRGYMEGAILTGEKGALEAIRDLKKGGKISAKL
jgi:monoamine oxidase